MAGEVHDLMCIQVILDLDAHLYTCKGRGSPGIDRALVELIESG